MAQSSIYSATSSPDLRHSPFQHQAAAFSSSYYDDSVSDAESEQWPLPRRGVGQRSSRGSNSPAKNGQRRTPRQSRDQTQNQPQSQSRQYYRSKGQSPHNTSHHGSGQWNGGGYNVPLAQYPSSSSTRPPPSGSAPAPTQPSYGTSRGPRDPPGPPYSSQRGPTATQKPSQPPAKDMHNILTLPADVLGANGSLFVPPVRDPLVKIPSYYFEEPDNADDTPVSPLESESDGERRDSDPGDAFDLDSPTLSWHNSVGKRAKPGLTLVTGKSQKASTRANAAAKRTPAQPNMSSGQNDFRTALPGAWVSGGPTHDENADRDHISETGSEVALATSTRDITVDQTPNRTGPAVSHLRRSSHLLGPTPSQPQPQRQSREIVVDLTNSQQDRLRRQTFSTISDGATIDDREPVSPLEPDDFLSPVEAKMERTGGGRKRPTEADIEAIKEAESRSSMTSLPDLIRRATKVRTNLDRGKTASRLGLNNLFGSSETDVNVEKYRADARAGAEKYRANANAEKYRANGHVDKYRPNTRRSASSQDRLKAFASAGGAGEVRQSMGNFSMLRHSRLPSLDGVTDSVEQEKEERQRKKYCGMPLWLCLVLILLVVLLVAAAIIIPIVLLVLPKQHHSNSGNSSSNPNLTPPEQCQTTLKCQNGGINIVTEKDPCSCLCVNGYTGSTCTVQEASGCTTIPVTTAVSDATIGEDVKTLVSSAGSTYNIPLDSQTILGLFSHENLSCEAENQLVTFTQTSNKARSAPNKLTSTPVPHHLRRKPRVHASTATTSSSAPAPATSSAAAGTPLEFAGVVVLYILQETGQHASAIEAQGNLQSFLASPAPAPPIHTGAANPYNVSLGNGFSADLRARSLVWILGNGTVVGN